MGHAAGRGATTPSGCRSTTNHPSPKGPTDTEHGLLLCVHHHDNRTTKGFRISGNPEHQLHFYRPDGTPIGTTRPPLHPDNQHLYDNPD